MLPIKKITCIRYTIITAMLVVSRVAIALVTSPSGYNTIRYRLLWHHGRFWEEPHVWIDTSERKKLLIFIYIYFCGESLSRAINGRDDSPCWESGWTVN